MRYYKRGFYSVFFLTLLVGVGIMIGVFYELGARSFKSREHYYLQLRFYDEGVPMIARACLKHYSLKECKSMSFVFGDYTIAIEMIAQDAEVILLDSMVQTQDLLSGQILRKVSRRILISHSP
ncbi:hypothetical protein HpCK38_18490 [Helicobacter pylori]